MNEDQTRKPTRFSNKNKRKKRNKSNKNVDKTYKGLKHQPIERNVRDWERRRASNLAEIDRSRDLFRSLEKKRIYIYKKGNQNTKILFRRELLFFLTIPTKFKNQTIPSKKLGPKSKHKNS